jgi:hypothetical protein
MTFRDAKEQAIKSVEALAECYDEVQRELIAARITIEQLNAELHPTRRLKLPTDPDVEPAVEPENKDEEMPTPTVKPYGQNGEDKCLKCGHPKHITDMLKSRGSCIHQLWHAYDKAGFRINTKWRGVEKSTAQAIPGCVSIMCANCAAQQRATNDVPSTENATGALAAAPLLAVGDGVLIIGGVYKGRSGIVRFVGEYWHEVKPDQTDVGGLNPRGCMIIGAKSEWSKTANCALSVPNE